MRTVKREMEKINVEELRNAIDLIFRHIKEDLDGTEVAINPEKQLYWCFGLNSSFDLEVDPIEAEVGSVRDDMEFLANMLRSADSTHDAPALMLEHAAGVLRYLAFAVRG